MIREFNGPRGFKGLHRIENSRKKCGFLHAKKCPKEDNIKYVHAKVVSIGVAMYKNIKAKFGRKQFYKFR